MSIPDKDTLRLFSYSAGLCNFCKVQIIEEHFESVSNFGERAHIYGKRKGSARFIDQNPDNNSYQNLILLCAKHHKLIDDHPTHYPVNNLLAIKTDHEMRIRQNPLIQSHGDVALIKIIFTVFPFMHYINLIDNQNLNALNLDVFDILTIQNTLEQEYKYDYPFKNAELQRLTKFMFYCLRQLVFYINDAQVFTYDDDRAYILNSASAEDTVEAWKYFNLSRVSIKNWYSYCKANYGI